MLGSPSFFPFVPLSQTLRFPTHLGSPLYSPCGVLILSIFISSFFSHSNTLLWTLGLYLSPTTCISSPLGILFFPHFTLLGCPQSLGYPTHPTSIHLILLDLCSTVTYASVSPFSPRLSDSVSPWTSSELILFLAFVLLASLPISGACL